MSNSSIWSIDKTLSSSTTPGHSGPGNDGNERCNPHSPKLHHYRRFTIRLLKVITRTFIDEVLPLCRDTVAVFISPSQLESETKVFVFVFVFFQILWYYRYLKDNWSVFVLVTYAVCRFTRGNIKLKVNMAPKKTTANQNKGNESKTRFNMQSTVNSGEKCWLFSVSCV